MTNRQLATQNSEEPLVFLQDSVKFAGHSPLRLGRKKGSVSLSLIIYNLNSAVDLSAH
jgi:hypothetical protein